MQILTKFMVKTIKAIVAMLIQKVNNDFGTVDRLTDVLTLLG